MKSLINRIKDFNAGRMPELKQRKFLALADNIFGFYRGTCHLFYEDLHQEPALKTGPPVWISGDLHLENFGSYRAANGLVYFDINDFDEAALAPAAWELGRFICSIGMASELWQYSMSEAKDLMKLFLEEYSAALVEGKAYAIQSETSPPLIQEFFSMAEKGKESDMIRARMDKKTERLKLIDGKTVAIPEEDRDKVLKSVNPFLHERYGYLTVHDALFRIAGKGSLGVTRYVLLVWDDRKEKWRLLDIKEALHSSLQPYLSLKQPSWTNEGDRVHWVQTQMQYALPRFFTPLTVGSRSFVLKQLQPSAQKIDHRLCHRKMKNVETVISTMAVAVASAQIRSASRKGSADVDALAAFGHDAAWREPLVKMAADYINTMNGYYDTWSRYMLDEGRQPEE